jgi:hypothetical protein
MAVSWMPGPTGERSKVTDMRSGYDLASGLAVPQFATLAADLPPQA